LEIFIARVLAFRGTSSLACRNLIRTKDAIPAALGRENARGVCSAAPNPLAVPRRAVMVTAAVEAGCCDAACGRTTQDDALRKEPLMELQMRLNVLAALLSLGFLAAILFGML
jgi:hypothetical protein